MSCYCTYDEQKQKPRESMGKGEGEDARVTEGDTTGKLQKLFSTHKAKVLSADSCVTLQDRFSP